MDSEHKKTEAKDVPRRLYRAPRVEESASFEHLDMAQLRTCLI